MTAARTSLGPQEAKALTAMVALCSGERGYGVFMRAIGRHTKLTKAQVRRAVRSLARKGYAEYIRGLFNEDDGLLAGSGYGLTAAGIARAAEVSA